MRKPTTVPGRIYDRDPASRPDIPIDPRGPFGGAAPDASWGNMVVAVLMDIRRELQQLNEVFRCPNVQAIPSRLRRIERNTRPPKQ